MSCGCEMTVFPEKIAVRIHSELARCTIRYVAEAICLRAVQNAAEQPIYINADDDYPLRLILQLQLRNRRGLCLVKRYAGLGESIIQSR